MPDDLTTRCLAEVERAMAAEPHSGTCATVPRLGQKGPPIQYCTCDRASRLRSRLARMLAAGVPAVAKAAYVIGALGESERLHEVEYDFLTALRKERTMNNPNASNALDLTQGTPGPNIGVTETMPEYHAYGPIVARTKREVVLLKRCVALERVLTPLVKFYRALPLAPDASLEVAVPLHKIEAAADVLDFGWWTQENV